MTSLQERYNNVLEKNNHHVEALDKIVKECCEKNNEHFEGNCFYKHTTFEPLDHLYNKQLNFFNLGAKITNMVEIGFNAGHSTLIFLLSNPELSIHCIDINMHSYTAPCMEYLQSQFPGRITYFFGHSHTGLNSYDGSTPELVHIDGCHDYNVANVDFWGTRAIARTGTIIVWDDTQIPHISALWTGYKNDRHIYDYIDETLLPTTHAVGILNKF